MPTDERSVLAAGAVILRPGDHGREVLLVHRPRYDDWSLPKGKAEPGEQPVETAAREVQEETGYICALGPEVAQVEYVDQRGRPKTVRYFVGRVVAGAFVANDEVDEVVWCTVDAARARLTRSTDADVVLAGLGAGESW